MSVDIKIKYSLDDILMELKHETSNDIICLKQNDKFFVGRGCEVPYSEDMGDKFTQNRKFMSDAYKDSLKHIAICTDNTTL